MAAIAQDQPAQPTQAPTQAAPHTKLPYYDLLARGREDPNLPPSQFNSCSLKSSPIISSTPALLQAFAKFVSAVTDLQDVSFVASTEERQLAIASVPGADKPRTFASDDVQLSTFTTNALDGSEFDFEIQILANNNSQTQPAAAKRVSETLEI